MLHLCVASEWLFQTWLKAELTLISHTTSLRGGPGETKVQRFEDNPTNVFQSVQENYTRITDFTSSDPQASPQGF